YQDYWSPHGPGRIRSLHRIHSLLKMLQNNGIERDGQICKRRRPAHGHVHRNVVGHQPRIESVPYPSGEVDGGSGRATGFVVPHAASPRPWEAPAESKAEIALSIPYRSDAVRQYRPIGFSCELPPKQSNRDGSHTADEGAEGAARHRPTVDYV